MSDAARIVCFPVIITATVLLSRRWPGATRRASRFLAAATGIALLCIITTGWVHRRGPVSMTHRWLPHGLIIWAWNAIPFAIGVTLARSRGRPLVTAALALGFMVLLGVLFLASVTGYLGPSHGPNDAMTLHRFQVLHYWAWPSIAIALVIWWYHSLRPDRDASPT